MRLSMIMKVAEICTEREAKGMSMEMVMKEEKTTTTRKKKKQTMKKGELEVTLTKCLLQKTTKVKTHCTMQRSTMSCERLSNSDLIIWPFLLVLTQNFF